jgi:hypothetical protein
LGISTLNGDGDHSVPALRQLQQLLCSCPRFCAQAPI